MAQTSADAPPRPSLGVTLGSMFHLRTATLADRLGGVPTTARQHASLIRLIREQAPSLQERYFERYITSLIHLLSEEEASKVDPRQLEKAFTEHTILSIVSHLAARFNNADELRVLCQECLSTTLAEVSISQDRPVDNSPSANRNGLGEDDESPPPRLATNRIPPTTPKSNTPKARIVPNTYIDDDDDESNASTTHTVEAPTLTARDRILAQTPEGVIQLLERKRPHEVLELFWLNYTKVKKMSHDEKEFLSDILLYTLEAMSADEPAQVSDSLSRIHLRILGKCEFHLAVTNGKSEVSAKVTENAILDVEQSPLIREARRAGDRSTVMQRVNSENRPPRKPQPKGKKGKRQQQTAKQTNAGEKQD